MRYIVVGMHAGYAGMDSWEFYEVSDSVTDSELEDFAWQRGKEHAEMYGIYPRSEYIDCEDVDLDDDCYSDNIEGWWEQYDPTKHDKHTTGGTPHWEKY